MCFQSADEKLRSLGHKGHHSSKANTSTYCGAQDVKSTSQVTPSASTHSVTSSRSEPPDIPPPPLPTATSDQNIQNQSNVQDKTASEVKPVIDSSVIDVENSDDIPPPLFPKPRLALMAERRAQRQNRKSGASLTGADNSKRRSRSEGPQGRRRTRNSMHETSSGAKSKGKHLSNGRYSMYSGNLSDEDDMRGRNVQSESDSADSDEQTWSKNPLMVHKSRKNERSKTDKRRSQHNIESNGQMFTQAEQVPNMFQYPQGRELYIAPRKPESSSNKAKFQRMEENRKKRIDMTVTSDEECSPQLRISRLRQRAILSSNLQNDQAGFRESINIIPQRGDSSQTGYHQNGFLQGERFPGDRVSVYNENRTSKYDENFNIDNVHGNFYQDYGKQEGIKRNKLPNVLPEYLPANRQPVNRTPSSGSYDNTNQVLRSSIPSQNIQSTMPANFVKNQTGIQHNQTNFTSESPKLRSFNEVKSNRPASLKKAIEKIEIVSRSPDSSSDSLDDLIESNIQYLESEIESGKLKRQSGNYSNYHPMMDSQNRGQIVRDQLRTSQQINAPDEFTFRLQDPRSHVISMQKQAPSVSQKPVHRSNMPRAENSCIGGNYGYNQGSEARHIPISGSATYSPYMQRKHIEPVEDMSKSDSQLNKPVQMPMYYPGTESRVPYPVLNQQTGNIMYVQQPVNSQQFGGSDGSVPAVGDSGMFSDVEYNIEVSERIKKWEKKLTPGEIEEKQRKVLNTIKEYESFSDSNQKDSLPETPLEIRREIRQLLSPTDNSGVGKLSVNLAKSNSSISDSNMNDSYNRPSFEPRVVSSETNLHRIFRVVHEPKSVAGTANKEENEMNRITPQTRRKKPHEFAGHTQSLGNVALSESEIGSNMQQSWPPIAIDSDSGIRKSWRTSRYEDEINELKEIVSDNFRDIRKKFDSDVSETDTHRASSPNAVSQKTVPNQKSGTATLTLNIQPVTPTKPRSPVTIRRKLSDQSVNQIPPTSPNTVPLTPKSERKLPVYRSVSVESKSQLPAPKETIIEVKPSYKPEIKPPTSVPVDTKSGPEVWSPNMESRKGLVSIERVKARTLQTIPFSEDPVWKEIEGLAAFEKPEEIQTEVTFDEIDELLKLAAGGVENIRSKSNLKPDDQTTKMMSSEMLTPTASNLSYADNLMTSSYSPHLSQGLTLKEHKARKLSDSGYPTPLKESKPVFKPPVIQPLKLNSKPKKSSTSALDEVLEDIRATLQKKPLSPKLMKNLDTSESNSSTNLSLQSPLTKSSKSFVFPREKVPSKSEPPVPPPLPAVQLLESVKTSTATPGYDNTQPNWQQPGPVPPELPPQPANAGYIDPEFTQFPYIINGNYHLDPNLLSEKLKNTGLVNESSDEHTHSTNVPSTNQQMRNKLEFTPANKNLGNDRSNQSKAPIHDLDQSVDDLKALAQEVEFKLNQIKSRIVSADENKLDSILVALRKFAPMTEQKYFNVKFTPDFESEKARRNKLEDALSELDRMYESLNLNDEALLDRASRMEETLAFQTKMKETKPKTTEVTHVATVPRYQPPSGDSKILRKSQIDEIERQTQNEFEDITKSFQVLLDEVTKQCRSVAQGAAKYGGLGQGERSLSSGGQGHSQQYSSQRPVDEIRHEPPRQQLRHDNQSARAVQDSYNTAIKELESVAMSNTGQSSKVPVQSSAVYLNIDKNKPNNQRMNEIVKNSDANTRSKNLDIQVESRSYMTKKNVTPNLNSPTGPKPFVSMATEFKPKLTVADSQDLKPNQTVTLQLELNNEKPQNQGRGGRFRKRGNIEHRKSMPAFTRTVETQTVETQTDAPPSVTEMKEKFEQIRKNSLQDYLRDSSPENKNVRPFMRKLSSTKVSDLYDSSEDERKRDSKIRHSLSAPDIVSLLDCLNEENFKRKKDNMDSAKKGTTQREDSSKNITTEKIQALEAELDSCVETPVRKPPVYPVWKYPGQADMPSPKKTTEMRKGSVSSDRVESVRTISDTESDITHEVVGATASGYYFEETIVRRRTRSVGAEQDNEDRPRSFHELVATFEKDPKRLEKLRLSGLRKCASEDSMFTDLILQKIYHSESDLYTPDGNVLKKSSSGSGLKLALEMKMKAQ